MWKIFFASSMATFVLNFLEALKAGGSVYLINSGLIKFGQQNSSPYNLVNLPIFFVFGYICGILGAAFVFANGKINKLRKRYLTTSGLKVAETCFVALLTSSVVYFLPLINEHDCRPREPDMGEEFRRYNCGDDEHFNGLASLFFNTVLLVNVDRDEELTSEE